MTLGAGPSYDPKRNSYRRRDDGSEDDRLLVIAIPRLDLPRANDATFR
jgi:hypothetical protein